MHLFLASWGVAFLALILAVPITAWIYGLMGDGLELIGWAGETVTALVVSAGQAGGYVLEQLLQVPRSYTSYHYGRASVSVSVFFFCFWLGYKITHLTTWDSQEYVILGLVDGVLAIALLATLTLG